MSLVDELRKRGIQPEVKTMSTLNPYLESSKTGGNIVSRLQTSGIDPAVDINELWQRNQEREKERAFGLALQRLTGEEGFEDLEEYNTLMDSLKRREDAQKEIDELKSRYGVQTFNFWDYLAGKGQTSTTQEEIDARNRLKELEAIVNDPLTSSRRDALIEQYKSLPEGAANAQEAKKQREEILAEIKAIDERYGNLPQDYDPVERTKHTISGFAQNTLSGIENVIGTTARNIGESLKAPQNQAIPQAVRDAQAQKWAEESAGEELTGNPLHDFSSRALTAKAFEETGMDLQAIADARKASGDEAISMAKGGAGPIGSAMVDIGGNVLQMGIDAAMGGLPALFVRAAGTSMQEARAEGATTAQQFGYGLLSGGIEVLTERMFDGVAHIFGGGMADAVVERTVRKMAQTDAGRTALRWLINATGEGFEEAFSDLLQPLAQLTYKQPSPYEVSDILYDFLIGTAIGALGGAGGIVTGQHAQANETLSNADAVQKILMESGWNRKQSGDVSMIGGRVLSGEELTAAEAKELSRWPTANEAITKAAESGVGRVGKTYTAITEQQAVSQALGSLDIEAEQKADIVRSYDRETQTPVDYANAAGAVAMLAQQGVSEADVKKAFGDNGLSETQFKAAYTAGAANPTPDVTGGEATVDGKKYSFKLEGADTVVFTGKDGETIRMSVEEANTSENVELPEQTAAFIRTLMGMGFGENTGEIFNLYGRNMRPASYLDAMNTAINVYAANGANLTQAVELLKSRGQKTGIVKLNAAQLAFAQKAGENLHTAQKTASEGRSEKLAKKPKPEKRRKGRLILGGAETAGGGHVEGVKVKDLNPQQKKTVKAIHAMADLIPIDFVVFNGERGSGTWGFFENNTVFININAGINGDFVAMATLTHELTHFMKDNAPKEYQALKDEIVRIYFENDPAAFEETVDQRRRSGGEEGTTLSYEAAVDEVIANSCMEMFNDSDAIDRLCRDNRSLGKWILDTLNKLIHDIFGDITRIPFKENEFYRAHYDAFAHARDLFAEGMAKAAENAQRGTVNESAAIQEAIVQGDETAVAESMTQLQKWTGEEPKKVQYGFKLMNVDETGLPHAMFIDAAKPYELGVWYAADSPKLENLLGLEPGYSYLVDENDNADMTTRKKFTKTTKRNKKGELVTNYSSLPGKGDVNKATEENKRWMLVDRYADGGTNIRNIGFNGSGSVSHFALRPGIHAVDIPSMAHIGAKDSETGKLKRRPDQRWFLIEYPVDVDYNQEAYSHESRDIRDHLPERGWYSFQTNKGSEKRQHWFITGGMRIVGAISEEGARKYARDRHFEEDLPWKDGKNYSEDTAIDLDEYIRTTKAQPTPSKAEMQQRIETERGTQYQKFDEEQQAVQNVGITLDEGTESAAPSTLYSRFTWEDSEYVKQRDEAVKALAAALGVSQKKARAYIDSVNGVAKAIADDQVRLDYEASPGVSALVHNTEYGASIDFSTICKKRRLVTGTFTAIQKALPNTALTADEILQIRKMMDDRGYEVNCGLCYVEGSRAKMGEYARQFLDEYAKTNPEHLPNMAEINTPEGIENIRRNRPEIYKEYLKFMNSLGQRKPRLYQLATAYNGEILKRFSGKPDQVKKYNHNGGLRLQSFSDFEIIHLIDNMQVIMDMARVGLFGQAYTKVPEFAWSMGTTGLKINLSLIARGVDTDGHLVLDEKEGMKRVDAEALRNAYPRNVGTIVVIFNDEQLKAAMADPFIDFIIPFHRSQWNKEQFAIMGLPTDAKDYTSWQNESYINPVYSKSGKRQRPDNYMPNNYWNFRKNGKANAEAYLKMCAENNRKPKFSNLLVNNGDGSYSLQPDGSTDGYWKLLIDFKMYDNNGKGAPQHAVKPIFNEGSADDPHTVLGMLKAYEGGHETFPVAQDVVDDFVARYKAENPRTLYQKFDASVNQFNNGFYSKAEQIVTENMPNRMAANQVIKFLTGKGVKTEEIRWSGLQPYLEGKKSVTKDELLSFLQANRVEVETDVLIDKNASTISSTGERYFDVDEWFLHLNSTYGEDSFTIRADDYEDPDSYTAVDLNGKTIETLTVGSKKSRWQGYTVDGAQNYREILFRFPGSEYSNPASRLHWKDNAPGVFAHARVDELEIDSGKRVLFIEEIQSDWHNEGAEIVDEAAREKRGFADGTETPVSKEEHEEAKNELHRANAASDEANIKASQAADEIIKRWQESGSEYAYGISSWHILNYMSGRTKYPQFTRVNESHLGEEEIRDGKAAIAELDKIITDADRKAVQDRENAANAIERALNALLALEHRKNVTSKRPPEAPFAGSADSYLEFVMKNLLRTAAEGDYDAIGWTSAEIQMRRWDGRYAEGYRIEYDQNLPKFMRKYGKQWGMTVGKSEIDEGEIWYADLTDAMKKSVTETGQTLYQKWADDEFNRQVTMDDLSYGEYSGDAENIRQQKQAAAELEQRVKDYFSKVSERSSAWMSPEEIEDAMELNIFGSRGDMSGADLVLINLSELAKKQSGNPAGRRETYELMEDILKHLPAVTQNLWTGKEPRSRGFAVWYREKHPYIYYKGYKPGDLAESRYNMEKEYEYLEEMLQGGKLTPEDRAEFEAFLKDLQNKLTGNDMRHRIFYMKYDGGSLDTAEETERRKESEMRLAQEKQLIRESIFAMNKAIRNAKGQVGATEHNEVREADVEKLARTMIRKVGSTAKVEDVAAVLKELGDRIVSAEELDYDELAGIAQRASKLLVDTAREVESQDEDAQAYREIAKEIQGTRFTFPTELRGELDQAGGFNAFRKGNMGRFILMNEGGESIDAFYHELQDNWGRSYFPDVANEGEEIMVISEIFDRSRPEMVNPYEYYYTETIESVKYEIMDEILGEGVRQRLPSAADRIAKAGELLKSENPELGMEQLKKAQKDLAKAQKELTAAEEQGRKAESAVQQVTQHLDELNTQLNRLQENEALLRASLKGANEQSLEDDQEIRKLRADRTELQKQIAKAQKDLAKLTADRNRVRQERNEKARALRTAQRKNEELRGKSRNLGADVRKLESARKSLENSLARTRERMDKLRAEKNERIAQIREEGAARVKEVRAAEKAAKWEKVADVSRFYQDQAKRAKERRDESASFSKYRRQVTEKAGKLYEMLMKNDDKLHVPEVLKAPLAAFLQEIDFTSKRQLQGGEETKNDQAFGARLQQLHHLLSNQQSYIEGTGEMAEDLGGYIDVSQDSLDFLRNTAELIAQALANGQHYTINRMTGAQLKDLSNFLSNLSTAIRNMNHFMANARYETVREAANSDTDYMQSLGRASESAESPLSKTLAWDNGTPYYVMKRFGEGGKSIFDGFARGWDQLAFDAQAIIKFTKGLYTDKEVQTWKREIHSFTLENGSEIRMTTAQIMELSMLLGREQAVQHMEHGGLRIGNIQKNENKRKVIRDPKHYHLTAEDIVKITGTLSGRQMEVARSLQSYMAKQGAEWGNEISMRRFGYKFYVEGESYYPIKTDSNDRPMSDTDLPDNASMFRLLNLSSSKALNPKASNALVVGDIFETFSDHMADMAKLHGMGLPILDAIKWFNYKERIDLEGGQYDTRTLRGAMEDAFGREALNYFRTLMKDINGVTESGDRGTEAFTKAMSRYKIASVGANLRVALLQPTSYVRALTVLKPQYIAGVAPSRAAYREAMENCGTAVWKSLGYYDTDISKSMRGQIQHDDTVLDKITEASMKAAELGDQLTWSRLWTACKRQVKAENKGLSGDALLAATADLFREVIYSSQVMDSTLTRSQTMRARTLYSKSISAFMAEPTLSYNVLMDAVSSWQLDERQNGKAGAWQRNSGKLGKALAVYVTSAAFSAVMESIMDAMRDDDDEEFLDKWLEALLGDGNLYKGNLVQDLSLLGKIPLLKNISSMLQGYSSGDMTTQGLSRIWDAFQIWKETIQLSTGTLEKATKVTYYGNMTEWGKIYKTLQALSLSSGFAVANLTRDVTAVWNTIMNGRKDEWKIRTYDSNRLSDDDVADWEEYVQASGITKGQYKQILSDANADGKNSTTQDEMGAYLLQQLEAGEITEDQAQALWKSRWHASGSKTFDKWRSSSDAETTESETTGSTEEKKVDGYEAFKASAPLYGSKKEATYNVWKSQLSGSMTLERFTEILSAADADGNDSLKQEELGKALRAAMNSRELSWDQANAIWNAQGWKRDFSYWSSRN